MLKSITVFCSDVVLWYSRCHEKQVIMNLLKSESKSKSERMPISMALFGIKTGENFFGKGIVTFQYCDNPNYI